MDCQRCNGTVVAKPAIACQSSDFFRHLNEATGAYPVATFDFTLTDQDAGRVLGVRDGFLTDLIMTASAVHEVPDFDPSKRHFTPRHLTPLRLPRSAESRQRLAADHGSAFEWFGRDANLLLNGSLGYAGDLIVVGAPKGATRSIALSDVPNQRPTPDICVSDRRAALERNAFPRQLAEARRAGRGRRCRSLARG
jgi:hypothetical protein